jgi:Arc/MetJ-type ribon-helix-helix transcriptional regulator
LYDIHYVMTLRKDRVLTVRIDDGLSDAMEALREKHGTPISEQVRRALRVWLESQGVMKAERQRIAPRKRP